MDLETAWRGLCIDANLHADTSIALLAEPLRPSLARIVDRFVGQPVPKSAAELDSRRGQLRVLTAIVTAFVDLGINGGPIEAAKRLAGLSLDQPDFLKFELEVEWILQRARR